MSETNGTKKRRAGKGADKRARQRRREGAAETIRKNVKAAKSSWREAERVAAERAVLEEEEARPPAPSRQVERSRERRRDGLEARALRLLERNDEHVRNVLAERKQVDGAYPLEGATDGDELLWVLVEHLDLLPALEGVAPAPTYYDEKHDKEVRRRFMYPPVVMNVLSIIIRMLGLESGPEVQTELLTDERWMALLGFAPLEVLTGHTHRSEGLSGKTRTGEGGRFEDAGELGPIRNRDDLKERRGVLSSQTVAGYEELVPSEKLVALMNLAIRRVAAKGLLEKRVEGVLDTTNIEVCPTFEGAGVVRRKVKAQSKSRKPKKVEMYIRGFKVWILMDSRTAIPLAVAMSTIETADVVLAQMVVEQARANLKGYAVLTGLAVDRGFLDGDYLWWLKKDQRVNWVCPSKEKMNVTTEARTLVGNALKKACIDDEEPLATATRLARMNQDSEGVSFHLRVLGKGRQPLVIANLEGLYETDFYGPGGSSSSRVHSKKYRPTLLHATVVLNWPDRSPQDREDEEEHDQKNKGPVVLLSPLKELGFQRYDRYDARSLIENQVNRDGKQNFSLGTALARNSSAMQTAVYFSVLTVLLWRVLLVLQEQAEETDRRAERLGIVRYRRLLKQRNRGKVMVYIDGRYAILLMHDFLDRLGVLAT